MIYKTLLSRPDFFKRNLLCWDSGVLEFTWHVAECVSVVPAQTRVKEEGSQTPHPRPLLHVPEAPEAAQLTSSAQEKGVEGNLISLPQSLHSAVCLRSFVHPFTHCLLSPHPWNKSRPAPHSANMSSNTFRAGNQALACFIHEIIFLSSCWSHLNI